LVRWLSNLTLRIFIVLVGVVSLIVRPTTPVQLSKFMFAVNDCDSPCLFGQSLQNQTPEQIVKLLHNSWAAEQVTYDGGKVSWNWNNVVWRAINRASPQDQYNVVTFNSNRLRSLEIHFSLPLEDLIDILGSPQFAFPFTYNHSFQMKYHLIFPNVLGRFSALTDCKQPKLLPQTPVIYYIYRDDPKFNSPTAPYVVWQGYTDNLPDCSIFTP
jgi:hypothetical protein